MWFSSVLDFDSPLTGKWVIFTSSVSSSNACGTAFACGFRIAVDATNTHDAANPMVTYMYSLYATPKEILARASSSPESRVKASVLWRISATYCGGRMDSNFGFKDLFVTAVPIDTAIKPPRLRNCD